MNIPRLDKKIAPHINQFEDRLLAQAKDGGHQAAILLRLQTEKYIRDIRPDWPHDLTIVTRVYANITGLSKASTDARIVPDSSRFEEFVRGFNMEHPLFDFLDSGSGKECADERLKGTDWGKPAITRLNLGPRKL